ncbi:MAG: formiminotransferase-cyclodeaminase [Microbacterium sp.]|nr:MAG: formiminotransferase-cyclodeaminase [Microbacterium sp.]
MSEPETPLAAAPIGGWLERLAAPVPDPGGGAAAGLVIATGAALVEMTAGYAAGAERDGILERASQARHEALAAADEDGRMSAALVAAFRMPADAAGRAAAIAETTVRAADSSAALVRVAASLSAPLAWLEQHGETRLAPDVAVAARLLAAGIRAAAVNIRCDATSAADAGAPAGEVDRLAAMLAAALDDAATLDVVAERVTATL